MVSYIYLNPYYLRVKFRKMLRNINSAGLLLSTILMITACSTTKKVASLKPLPDYGSTDVVYQKQLSFISMPIEIAVADLQTQTNKYLNGVIYDDTSMDGDNLMLKVTKQAPIIINEKAGKLEMELPLKIWSRYKYGVQSFGIDLTDTRDVNLNGRVKLSASVGLVNWKITTNTTIQDIQWVENPSVSIAGKNVPITYLINPALLVFKSRLAKIVDDAIAQSLDIKPYVMDALSTLSKPTKVNDEYNTWFAMQPVEIYATKMSLANKKLTANMGMKAFLETAIGREPSITFNKDQIQLKTVQTMPNEFNVNVASFATYQYASALVQKNFAGQKFESGKRAVVVNKIDLWGKEGKMIVAVNLSGSVNGDFYLSGVPMYDASKKEIYLNEVDFVLDSKNKLIKAGDWIAHGLILKKMADACRFSVAEQLAEGQKTMTTYLTNYEPMKGVKVNGKLNQITPGKVILTPNAIVAMVVATGKVAVSVDGME